MVIEIGDLAKCPHCGAGETRISELHLPPRMSGPGALIAVTIRHWCTNEENFGLGVLQSYREVRARDHASVLVEWNRRV